MKLPDFLQFEPFNRLREAMGAEDLGDFVFFDPKKNLTGLERIELANQGLPVNPKVLQAASDFTLVFKDSRVLIYHPAPQQPGDWHYHLAECDQVQSLRTHNLLQQLQAKTALPQSEIGNYKVCSDCLQKLRYQNFDAARQRHREYSQRIADEFSLDSFFDKYPVYPVEIKQETPIF
ncbi:MAG: hypothetical protein AseanaTS_16680 [Candidatus Pelagadaptatus aseana]|uniref:hypothetical protein n=1 Tax=Candidatus Pelagadaptatus aseana TaxID=3120508 RepID=UPI0039B2D13A